ncbi:hypothetical protein L9F63_022177, partial [Diploptera punctata]
LPLVLILHYFHHLLASFNLTKNTRHGNDARALKHDHAFYLHFRNMVVTSRFLEDTSWNSKMSTKKEIGKL